MAEQLHWIVGPADEDVKLVLCPDCGQMEWWTEDECIDHGKCRASNEPCPVCEVEA
jgi:hypothetical protein